MGARSAQEIAEKVKSRVALYFICIEMLQKYCIHKRISSYTGFIIPAIEKTSISLISNAIAFIQVWTGAYYSFLIVRHPFDRVLSAYRDRIANIETGQAQHHIPRIYVALKV